MPIDVLPARQYAAPAAADGVALVLPGSAWAYSNEEDLVASADADLILTGIVARPVGIIFTGYRFEIEVLTDAQDDPIATFQGFLSEVFATVGSEGCYIRTPIGIDNIPLGARVFARMRGGTTTTPTFHVSATYLKKPLVGSLLTTANPLLCFPSGAAPIDVATGVGAWNNGAAVEVFDGSGPARAIVGVEANFQHVGLEWQGELCTGVGNDLVDTFRGAGNGVSSYPNVIAYEHPLVIPAETSMSVRSRSEDVSSLTLLFAVSYFEMPL